MARILRGCLPHARLWRRSSGTTTAVASLVTAPGSGGVTSITLDGSPEQPGQFAVCIGMNATSANGTWQSPVTSLYADNNGTLAASIGWFALITATETLSLNVTRTRIRVPIYDQGRRVVDYKVSYGSGTSATQSALDVSGAPGAKIYDFTYSPTAGLTIGDPSNMENHSGNSSGSSWRSAILPGDGPVGDVASFTPAAVSLSSSVNWARASVAVE